MTKPESLPISTGVILLSCKFKVKVLSFETSSVVATYVVVPRILIKESLFPILIYLPTIVKDCSLNKLELSFIVLIS